jgi:hypothetical protein
LFVFRKSGKQRSIVGAILDALSLSDISVVNFTKNCST